MKQIDRIRNMNAEEIAKEDLLQRCKCCAFFDENKKLCTAFGDENKTCVGGVKAWLESEVEDDDRT